MRQAVLNRYSLLLEEKFARQKQKQQKRKATVRTRFGRQVDERHQIILTKSRFYTEKSQTKFDQLKTDSLENQRQKKAARLLLQEKNRRALNEKREKKVNEREESRKRLLTRYNQIILDNKV